MKRRQSAFDAQRTRTDLDYSYRVGFFKRVFRCASLLSSERRARYLFVHDADFSSLALCTRFPERGILISLMGSRFLRSARPILNHEE